MIKLLLVNSLLLLSANVYANKLSEYSPNGIEQWSLAHKLNAKFVEKFNANYLVVMNSAGETVAQQLIPRAKSLSDITWSGNGEYLTYIKNDSSLWLFNVRKNSATLVDLNFHSDTPLKHGVQWSANGQWMQFLSSKNPGYLARVYSLKRKRSYLVPVASEQITAIAWHENKNELLINTTQNLADRKVMSLYGIKVTVNGQTQLAKLH